jgi:excisionase family DNA binding protein
MSPGKTGGPVNETLLSVAEASELLGVSQMTARRLLDNREIEYLRISNIIRIPQEALVSYMDAATVKPLR